MGKILSFLLLLSSLLFPQWSIQTVPSGMQNLFSISFVNQRGVIGGYQINPIQSGRIAYTTNGGENWIGSSVPANALTITNVQMINDLTGFAAGTSKPSFEKGNLTNNGLFLKTTDGGVSWTNYSSLPDGITGVNGLVFFNESTGLITADSSGTAYLYKTTDGGLSWHISLGGADFTLLGKIVFSNQTNGIVYGISEGTNKIFRTTNSGLSWISNNNISDPVRDIAYSDSGTFYYITHSRGFKSTDAGITWNQMSLDNGNFYEFTRLSFFPGGSNGFVMSDNLIIDYFRTTDRGNTWTPAIPFPQSDLALFSTYMVSDQKWYVLNSGFEQGSVFVTTNGGTPVELTSFTSDVSDGNVVLSWTTATETNNRGFEIERLYGINNDWSKKGFVIGNGTSTEKHEYTWSEKSLKEGKYSYRLKQIDLDGSFEYSKSIDVSVETPDNFALFQNYPNPWNPSTNIKYSIPKASPVSIKVYGIPGDEIETLVNENKPAGNYELTFNAANLPSGVYFYRIQAGSFVETKKMTLLK
jgi:photosystem II stability/assembly factor-like uncharacterized protein